MKTFFKSFLHGIILAIAVWMMILLVIKSQPTNPDFDYFVRGMEKDFPTQFASLRNPEVRSITFHNNKIDSTIAICYPAFNHIRVSRAWWNFLSDIERRSLIYHEIAHCTFKQDHRDDLFINGCPMSIMNSFIPSKKCLDENWEYYKHELFNPYDIKKLIKINT